MEKMSVDLKALQAQWKPLRPWFTIRNERDYDQAIRRLNELLDEIGADEEHPLYSLLDALGTMISAYEDKHHALLEPGGAEMLKHFMEEQGLTQSDLPEIGSQGVVSEILNGKRELNLRQVRALAKRFRVSPAVFV